MENQKLDGAFTANKRIIEQVGYIKGQIEIMGLCLRNIETFTEHDIWFPAWEKVREGMKEMHNLIDKGMIR